VERAGIEPDSLATTHSLAGKPRPVASSLSELRLL